MRLRHAVKSKAAQLDGDGDGSSNYYSMFCQSKGEQNLADLRIGWNFLAN
jgi:hypothetical protein